MYLWDSNIVRHFGEDHPTLRRHLQRVSWSEIALPSVAVAEILRGRCDFALKAPAVKAALAHSLLMQTQRYLNQFNVIVFDEECAKAQVALQRRHKTHKRYSDILIAAMVKAGKHILVTRNTKDFANLLDRNQLANWIDDEPA